MQSELTERAKTAWNSIADEFNQWDALGLDEQETYVALTAALVDVPAEPNWKAWATELEEYLRAKGDFGYPSILPHSAPSTSPPLSREGEDSAEVERLRDLLSRAEEYVIDGVTNAKAEAEMNAPYPARVHRYDAALAEVRQLYADIQAALAATRSGSATTSSGGQSDGN